ncbi:TIGR03032 family protein [Novipirellula caenicola]|uniref:Conserved hypothetical protein CHP03032 domain-containing protein n=1 Tax=Novipirellula caenicola TaxID=1536901 RepID=A0ABP9VTG5_9BACT
MLNSIPQTSPLGFNILSSRNFTSWLASENVSLALSTYQSGELFLIGRQADNKISIFERKFARCMGLWSDSQTLCLASVYQIWRMENMLVAGQMDDGYDRVYVPRVGYTTGDVDAHDVAMESDGRLVFVSTMASCLATTSDRYNLQPLWHPPFISKIAWEDRCHLNGLALKDGQARYVTCCSQSDIVDGWRDARADGGCVIDITSNEIITQGLSMPHSPRVYRDRLWLLDSGRGNLGFIDLATGKFEPIAFCPGYARGLAFVGDYAVVGLSLPRRENSFHGLDLDQNLAKRGARARCGLQVIDLRSGDAVQWIRIEGNIQELYDVVTLPGVVRPKALGFLTDEIHHSRVLPPQVNQL